MNAMHSETTVEKDPVETDLKNKNVSKNVKPPVTFEEFLAINSLTDWPNEVKDETLIGDFDLNSEEKILELLKSAAIASDFDPLQELSERIRKFEEKVYEHSERLLIFTEKPQTLDPSSDPCSQKSPGEEVESQLNEEEYEETEEERLYRELEKNSIEFHQFPGFDETRLTNLPGNREPAPILDTVTVAQAFKPGFVKFWNKIFQSEASVAILQDAFWWIFLDRFQAKQTEDRSRLFDRIADSFVALVTSINLELKDKFLVVYADCLAQAIFVTFYHSFPASLHRFNEEFKEYVISVVHEWVTGGLPPAGRSAKWSKALLEVGHVSERPGPCGLDISGLSAIVHGHSAAAATGSMMDYKAAKFKEVVSTMAVDLYDDEKKMITTVADLRSSRLRFQSLTQTDASECRQHRKQSDSVGGRQKKERVLFNMKAPSPLVAHYLKLLGLRAAAAAADAEDGEVERRHKVPRTHIIRQPPTESSP